MPKKKKQFTRGEKTEHGAKETHDAFVADICSSIDNAVKILDSKEKITLDKINRPKQPKQLSATEIANIRAKKLKLSQSVFALLLNVSLKTVQAWEQSLNRPNGAALRLLDIIKEHPDDLKAFVFGEISQR